MPSDVCESTEVCRPRASEKTKRTKLTRLARRLMNSRAVAALPMKTTPVMTLSLAPFRRLMTFVTAEVKSADLKRLLSSNCRGQQSEKKVLQTKCRWGNHEI